MHINACDPDLSKDQAFMVDPSVLKWIVSQAGLRKTDTVLEIGAGTGNLTREIAKSGANVIAVEIDPRLEDDLRRNTRKYGNVDIVMGNGLEAIDSRAFEFNKIASNIPYAISEALIQRLIFHNFDLAVLTLPKSFAHRLIAAEWEKEYSRLSFVFQRFFMVQSCLDLQRETFRPVPKTNSVVIRFDTKPKNSLFCQMFLRPDMTAKNALREALCSSRGYTKNQARETIKDLNLKIILNKKVSELSVDDIKGIVRKAATIGED